MSIYTYHLANADIMTSIKTLLFPPRSITVEGLVHAECMTSMVLGSAIVSPSRMRLRNLAVFAEWESEEALDDFLENHSLGRVLAKGWHVRMTFIRRWGHVDEFGGLPETVGEQDMEAAVVSVTLARMKLLQVPRFIRWGKPVEKFVRDHPAKTIATAAIRLPVTVSTFSIWRTQREMIEMVYGKSNVSGSRKAYRGDERAKQKRLS